MKIQRSIPVLAVLCACPAAFCAQAYELIDLGLSPTGGFATTAGLNNGGAILWSSSYFLPTVGGVSQLIPGYTGASGSATVADLNDSGWIVGEARTTSSSAASARALRFNPTTGTSVNLGGIGERSTAVAINATGAAVGHGRFTSSSGSQRALLFDASGFVTNLATTGFITTESSWARDISDSGQIIGYGRPTGSTQDQALLFNGLGGATVLVRAAGQTAARANGINNNNQAVGYNATTTQATLRAASWDLLLNTVTIWAAPPNIGGGYQATKVNDNGVAIGIGVQGGTLSKGLVFIAGQGYDISNNVVNPPVNFEPRTLTGINNAGEITGWGLIDGVAGQTRPFLLRPVANPKVVQGTVDLQGLSISSQGQIVEVEVLQNGNVLQKRQLGLGPTGEYYFYTNLSGSYDIRFRGVSTWLRKQVSNVTLSSGTPATVNVSLVNGDVNGDNEVGAADFSILAAAYDFTNTEVGYSLNADLNKDGEVGAADFSILAASYDAVGE